MEDPSMFQHLLWLLEKTKEKSTVSKTEGENHRASTWTAVDKDFEWKDYKGNILGETFEVEIIWGTQ